MDLIRVTVTQGGKNLSTAQETQEIGFRSLGHEDPWRRKWQPTPVFLSGEIPQKEEELGGYSPWGHKRVGHDQATKHTCSILTHMILL